MDESEFFTPAPDTAAARADACALFEIVAGNLVPALPPGAEVRHVGATAVPGCVTKGDLDIAIRVDAADFARSDAILADRYERNTGSVRTRDFAAFEDATRKPHLGLQLTVRGGPFDVFHHFVDALRADPQLVRRYNALKVDCQNAPMTTYRAAKAAFIRDVLKARTEEA